MSFFNDILQSDIPLEHTSSTSVLAINRVSYDNNAINYDMYGNSKQEYITIDDVQYKLPTGYTVLDYIESTGTQYIDTGLLHTDLIVEYTACTTESSATSQIFLATSTNTNWVGWKNGNPACDTTMSSINATQFRDYKVTYTSSNISLEDVATSTINTTSNGSLTNTLRYFAWDTSYPSKTKLKHIKFSNSSGTVLQNLIPMKNSSNVLGMYDFVTNTFYTNAGTGTFTAGNEAPCPERPVDVVSCGDKVYDIPYELYTPVEYIASSGTQYIDTGYVLSSTDKVDIKCQWLTPTTTTSSSTYAFGTYHSGENFGINRAASTGSYCVWGSSSTGFTPEIQLNTDYEIVLTNGTFTINGVATSYTPSATFTGTLNAYLFWANGTSQLKGNVRIYNCKFYNSSNTLTRNFIPVLRKSDSTYGMYDTVTQAFYVNSGTGTFTGGSARTDLYKIPIKVNDQLPAGYTELSYIESTGTQYIDTGVSASQFPIDINLTFAVTGAQAYGSIISIQEGGSDNYIVRYEASSGHLKWYPRGGSYDVGTCILNQKYNAVIHYESGSSYFTLDNVTTNDSTTWASGLSSSFVLNAGSTSGGNLGKNAIYGCVIKVNNITTRNFIPAKRNSDSVIGMYDTVNDVFYTNSGTGTFTAGEEVGTTVTAYLDEPIRKVGTYSDYIFWGAGKNLTDRSTDLIGYYLVPSTGQQSTESSSECTDYIKCKPNTTYTVSFKYLRSGYFMRVHTYNSSKAWIELNWAQSSGTVGSIITQTFTTGSTAEYIRMSFPISDENIQIEEGSTATTYQPYTLTPKVVRNVGYYECTGAETDWAKGNVSFSLKDAISVLAVNTFLPLSNIGTGIRSNITPVANSNQVRVTATVESGHTYINFSPSFTTWATVSAWTTYLATQYSAGTPVTVYYPLATATTEALTDLPAIPLVAGTDEITVNTTVVPSAMNVKAWQWRW